jgi:Uma2 family endonuclease
MAEPSVRYRADYLWESPDDGNRYEVIDGELYVSPPPSWMHQYGLGNLYLCLGSWIKAYGLGKIVPAPTGVVLGPDTGVEPDLVYVSREREGIISARGVEGAPDLVVEVLSPSTRATDRGRKMRRYAAAGISHYWILDPRARALST